VIWPYALIADWLTYLFLCLRGAISEFEVGDTCVDSSIRANHNRLIGGITCWFSI
jgi:hypothetical protein